MTRVLGAVILTCLAAGSAWADVTVKSTVKGPMGDTPQVVYIKGSKMRTDSKVMGRDNITIVDAAARQMISLDPSTRTATVYDLSKMGEQIQKEANPSDIKVSLTPTGQTKQILGRACTEYILSISFSMAPPNVPQSQGMAMTIGGPTWIAKGAPGTKDFEDFYKAASESGLFFNPGGAGGRGRGMGPSERSMAAMYKAYAEAGGIPYEQVMETKFEGSGPMAQMMRGRGGMGAATTMAVTGVSTDPVPADMFEIPAGYTKKTQ